MYSDAKKIHLIEVIIRSNDDALLRKIEADINDAGTAAVVVEMPPSSILDLAGSITEDEANDWLKAIDEDCANIDEDGWK